jgi:hypothetical protein
MKVVLEVVGEEADQHELRGQARRDLFEQAGLGEVRVAVDTERADRHSGFLGEPLHPARGGGCVVAKGEGVPERDRLPGRVVTEVAVSDVEVEQLLGADVDRAPLGRKVEVEVGQQCESELAVAAHHSFPRAARIVDPLHGAQFRRHQARQETRNGLHQRDADERSER